MTRAPPKLRICDPTEEEIKEIQRLIERAGGERELHRWIRIALGKRGRGRPPGATRYANYDNQVLLIADTLSALSRGKLSFNRALEGIVKEPGPLQWNSDRGGASSDAAVKRLHAKFLAERRAFDKLSKSEIKRWWTDFENRHDSPGDEIAALFIALIRLLKSSRSMLK
jgi:hypothetical protein